MGNEQEAGFLSTHPLASRTLLVAFISRVLPTATTRNIKIAELNILSQ